MGSKVAEQKCISGGEGKKITPSGFQQFLVRSDSIGVYLRVSNAEIGKFIVGIILLQGRSWGCSKETKS